ncbi:hypothetical protein GCHA_1154 [Paraglaciecola chathamensis S18K6]|uniref:Uncharacterized protein n=1 Tax=Paraglaciecola chathamensis S18K6 TaxID=1127672 RepID=A0AAV3UVN6_9ALTE|nr:hypothetical protein GCHA_1154 [Paraglaciecola chathamensis S18K6]
MCPKKYAYVAYTFDTPAPHSNKKTPLLINNKGVYQQSFNALFRQCFALKPRHWQK